MRGVERRGGDPQSDVDLFSQGIRWRDRVRDGVWRPTGNTMGPVECGVVAVSVWRVYAISTGIA